MTVYPFLGDSLKFIHIHSWNSQSKWNHCDVLYIYTYTYICEYILHIYIYRERERERMSYLVQSKGLK
jgi:hypothetical protein